MKQIAIIIFLVLSLGCSRKIVQGPAIVTHTTLETDSLTSLLSRLLVQSERQSETLTLKRIEKYKETTVLNDRGDTLRHDTHSEITAEYVARLEKENRLLRIENDSLHRVKNRVDSVPVPYEIKVPYPVERQLTWWERIRLDSWWWLAGMVVVAVFWKRIGNAWRKITEK